MSDAPHARPSNWEGDYWGKNGTLARDYAQYLTSLHLQNPHAEIPWFSTLYSAANRAKLDLPKPIAIARMLWILWHWRPIAKLFIERAESTSYLRELAPKQLEPIGAILLGYARIPLLGGNKALGAAYVYAREAYTRRPQEIGSHDFPLAALTLAKIELLYRDTGAARKCLADAQEHVAMVSDRNQRSRIYRGIAEVQIRIFGQTKLAQYDAREALDAADKIPGIGADVQAKNAAMRKQLGL